MANTASGTMLTATAASTPAAIGWARRCRVRAKRVSRVMYKVAMASSAESPICIHASVSSQPMAPMMSKAPK
ncbi:hypothetical protein D3C81_1217490 [compost metagenome]